MLMSPSSIPSSTSSSAIYPVQRVLQLDAGRLDKELHTLFHTSLLPFFRNLPSSGTDPSALLTLLLRLLHHFNTIHRNEATPGNELQSLKYTSSTGGPLSLIQRYVHLLCNAVLPFLYTCMQRARHPIIASLTTPLAALRSVCVLANRAYFLRTGQYSSLAHRIANTRVEYVGRPTSPRAAFQLVDRQLVWQGLAELALCVAPIIRQLISSRSNRPSGATHRASVTSSSGEGSHVLVCPVCQATPTMAHVVLPCRCFTCYVCIHHHEATSCPGCGTAITAVKRVEYS